MAAENTDFPDLAQIENFSNAVLSVASAASSIHTALNALTTFSAFLDGGTSSAIVKGVEWALESFIKRMLNKKTSAHARFAVKTLICFGVWLEKYGGKQKITSNAKKCLDMFSKDARKCSTCHLSGHYKTTCPGMEYWNRIDRIVNAAVKQLFKGAFEDIATDITDDIMEAAER